MDRGKKGKIQHSSADLFALGKNDNRKRESGGTSSAVPIAPASKKPRISAGTSSKEATTPSTWEDAINTECENSVDLISSVLQATDQQDSDKIVSLVCSALKNLTKAKNDQILVMSLTYLAKIRPHIFANDNITAALISLLKVDPQHTVRHTPKHNSTIFVMATNLLARGHFDKKKWPESFVKVYIDDAVNERLWVDLDECSFFIDHISKFENMTLFINILHLIILNFFIF